MAGDSGTPLSKKLGIKSGHLVHAIAAPHVYRALLDPLPDDVTFTPRLSSRVDLVHVFVTEQSALASLIPRIRKVMKPDAAVWVSWPKKASKMQTDVTEHAVRAVALPVGLVDVKVCAVDDVWSGLKLVVRQALR